MTDSRNAKTVPRKGDLGWAHHPSGGIIIDIVGDIKRMPSPYGRYRKLGPYGFPMGYVHGLDTLPSGVEVYSLSTEAAQRLTLTLPVKTTTEVVETWKALVAR